MTPQDSFVLSQDKKVSTTHSDTFLSRALTLTIKTLYTLTVISRRISTVAHTASLLLATGTPPNGFLQHQPSAPQKARSSPGFAAPHPPSTWRGNSIQSRALPEATAAIHGLYVCPLHVSAAPYATFRACALAASLDLAKEFVERRRSESCAEFKHAGSSAAHDCRKKRW